MKTTLLPTNLVNEIAGILILREGVEERATKEQDFSHILRWNRAVGIQAVLSQTLHHYNNLDLNGLLAQIQWFSTCCAICFWLVYLLSAVFLCILIFFFPHHFEFVLSLGMW